MGLVTHDGGIILGRSWPCICPRVEGDGTDDIHDQSHDRRACCPGAAGNLEALARGGRSLGAGYGDCTTDIAPPGGVTCSGSPDGNLLLGDSVAARFRTADGMLAVVGTVSAPPAVTAMTPSAGPLAGGNATTISGSGFTGATFPVRSRQRGSIPGGLGHADLDDCARGFRGGNGRRAGNRTRRHQSTGPQDQYTYLPLPVVTSVSPNSGPVSGGTRVTIQGSGLTGATSIMFGSTPAPSPTSVLDNQITVSTPAVATAGVVDVTVTTPGGVSVSSAADRFSYLVPTPCSHAYVANTGSDSVSVIDSLSRQVVRAFAVPGAKPDAVAVDSSGMRLYVAGLGDNTIYRLDAASGSVLSTFNLQASGGACGPISIAVNSTDSGLYVEGSSCATATVLDTSNSSSLALVRTSQTLALAESSRCTTVSVKRILPITIISPAAASRSWTRPPMC